VEPRLAFGVAERTVLIHVVGACVDGDTCTSSLTLFRTGDASVSHSARAIGTADTTSDSVKVCSAFRIANKTMINRPIKKDGSLEIVDAVPVTNFVSLAISIFSRAWTMQEEASANSFYLFGELFKTMAHAYAKSTCLNSATMTRAKLQDTCS